jgi:hypothetical protein
LPAGRFLGTRPPHRASSAHTYRLLVFKDRSASRGAAPASTTRHCVPFCVAASAAEKRDYGERPATRQPLSANFFARPAQNRREHVRRKQQIAHMRTRQRIPSGEDEGVPLYSEDSAASKTAYRCVVKRRRRATSGQQTQPRQTSTIYWCAPMSAKTQARI